MEHITVCFFDVPGFSQFSQGASSKQFCWNCEQRAKYSISRSLGINNQPCRAALTAQQRYENDIIWNLSSVCFFFLHFRWFLWWRHHRVVCTAAWLRRVGSGGGGAAIMTRASKQREAAERKRLVYLKCATPAVGSQAVN